jgi:hypothetical protein
MEDSLLIAEDSPLRLPPPGLDRKQTLYFDGIRYSVDMAHLAHARLRRTLRELTHTPQKHERPPELEIVSAILDAWSIVDAVYRLRKLLLHCPGLKQKTPPMTLFRTRTEGVESLRNSVQHLNTEINALVTEGVPVWGVLSWCSVLDPATHSMYSCSLISGTMLPHKGHPVVNPLGRPIVLPVDLITLAASGYSVCLSDVMREVESLTRALEEDLRNRFTDLAQGAADLLVCIELSAKQATERASNPNAPDASPEPDALRADE